MSEGLSRSDIHRNLDAKFKIGGLEALDLIVALLFGAVMNLLFSGTSLGVPLVIGGPIFIIAIFYFGKKGKPENYLAHLIKFYLEPGSFLAGEKPKQIEKVRSRICE